MKTCKELMRGEAPESVDEMYDVLQTFFGSDLRSLEKGLKFFGVGNEMSEAVREVWRERLSPEQY